MSDLSDLFRHPDKWKVDSNFRYTLMRLAILKREVQDGHIHRTNTMLDAHYLVCFLRDYVASDPQLDLGDHFTAAAECLGITSHELRLLAEIGSLISEHERAQDLDPCDRESYWEKSTARDTWSRLLELLPSMPSSTDIDEIVALERLFDDKH